MKRFSLKLACIFIIAIFCLAPLGAIDLNQDDGNTKYISQEGNQSNIDVKNISDIGINETDIEANLADVKTNDSKTEAKNSTDGNLGTSVPDFGAYIPDIYVGETPVIHIFSDSKLSGSVVMSCPDFAKDYKMSIENAYSKYVFNEYDLKPGTYYVKVSYSGDKDFEPKEITVKFKVKKPESEKVDPKLSIHVDDCEYSYQPLHVIVHADENFTGNVTLSFNNRVYLRQMEVVNGYGQSSYPNGDMPGTYVATAKTDGNDYFAAGNCSTTYTVKKRY